MKEKMGSKNRRCQVNSFYYEELVVTFKTTCEILRMDTSVKVIYDITRGGTDLCLLFSAIALNFTKTIYSVQQKHITYLGEIIC